jgi:hypothetical protein
MYTICPVCSFALSILAFILETASSLGYVEPSAAVSMEVQLGRRGTGITLLSHNYHKLEYKVFLIPIAKSAYIKCLLTNGSLLEEIEGLRR